MTEDLGIQYDCRWSDQLDEKFVKDFIDVECQVFGSFELSSFNRKFIENIYGPSVLAVVYINGKPSAARALWRNDINGRKAYQPGNTCVLSVCRGKGIFSEMTRRTVNMLDKEDVIYNFPNPNSFPGYIKMGWKLVGNYNMVLLLSNKQYAKEHVIDMDEAYAAWWLKDRMNIYHIKRENTYYLIMPHARKFCYRVISRVNDSIALTFPKFKGFGLIFYHSLRKTFYNSRFASLHVVSKTPDIEEVPIWKIDAL